MCIVGLIDDICEVKPNFRIVAQIVTTIFFLKISPLNNILLNYFNKPLLVIILMGLIFMSVACINFINFGDGIDGLLAGCMIIIFSTISIYFNLNFWPYVSCLIGFLLLNWQPSKVFMGDIGSTFLGALFLGVILQTDNFIEALKILLLASPLLGDALISVIRRLLSGKSIIIPHKSFYFKRLNEGGLMHREVSIIYMIATFLICICLLFGNLYWMIGAIIFELIVLLYLEKKLAIQI